MCSTFSPFTHFRLHISPFHYRIKKKYKLRAGSAAQGDEQLPPTMLLPRVRPRYRKNVHSFVGNLKDNAGIHCTFTLLSNYIDNVKENIP